MTVIIALDVVVSTPQVSFMPKVSVPPLLTTMLLALGVVPEPLNMRVPPLIVVTPV